MDPTTPSNYKKGHHVQTRTQRTLPLLQFSIGCSEKITPASKLKFKKAKAITTQFKPFSGVPLRSLRPDLQKTNDETVSAVLLQCHNFHFFSQTMKSFCQTEIATNNLQFVFSKSTKKSRLLPAATDHHIHSFTTFSVTQQLQISISGWKKSYFCSNRTQGHNFLSIR